MTKTDRAPVTESSTLALKALSHPDRLRMLGLLQFDGPDTASGLARRMSLNSGATSYHLRQLAKYGFIEPADDMGNKRDRFWRARADAGVYDPVGLEGEAQDAAMAMVAGLISQHVLLLQRALGQFPSQPKEWQAASNVSDYTLRLTADEAFELKEELTALLWKKVEENRPREEDASETERQFMVMLHAFPRPRLDDDGAGGGSNG